MAKLNPLLIACGILCAGTPVMALAHGGHGHARAGVGIGVAASPQWRHHDHPRFVPLPVIVPLYRPVVVAPPPQVVYIEQGGTPAYWYYCAEAGAYFPYVQQCPQGWQRVPAQPAN